MKEFEWGEQGNADEIRSRDCQEVVLRNTYFNTVFSAKGHTEALQLKAKKDKNKTVKWRDNNLDDKNKLVIFYIPPYSDILFK